MPRFRLELSHLCFLWPLQKLYIVCDVALFVIANKSTACHLECPNEPVLSSIFFIAQDKAINAHIYRCSSFNLSYVENIDHLINQLTISKDLLSATATPERTELIKRQAYLWAAQRFSVCVDTFPVMGVRLFFVCFLMYNTDSPPKLSSCSFCSCTINNYIFYLFIFF